MNLVGDPISSLEALDFGLVNRVCPDQELFDVALNWGRRLAGQAPLAVEQVKLVSFSGGDPDQGIEDEKEGRVRGRTLGAWPRSTGGSTSLA